MLNSLVLKIFIRYTMHIGHSEYNSLMLSAWFFYKLKNKIWIINLFKTLTFFKLMYKFLEFVVGRRLPFWFVNIDLEKGNFFKGLAHKCGEFACTHIWVRGLLSNYKSILYSLKKFFLKHAKVYEYQEIYDTFFLTRYSWPRGIFLPYVNINSIVCREAASINLPVIAIVDTNINCFTFSIPIPSNDDSWDSVSFITLMISNKILLSKYKFVLLWYLRYKPKNYKIYNRVYSTLTNKKTGKISYYFNLFENLFKRTIWGNLIVTCLFYNYSRFKANMSTVIYDRVKKIQFKPVYYSEFKLPWTILRLVSTLNFYSGVLYTYRTKYGYTVNSTPKSVLYNTSILKKLPINSVNLPKVNVPLKQIMWRSELNYFLLFALLKKNRIYYDSYMSENPVISDLSYPISTNRIFKTNNFKKILKTFRFFKYNKNILKKKKLLLKKLLYFNSKFINYKWYSSWVYRKVKKIKIKGDPDTDIDSYVLYPMLTPFAYKDGYRFYRAKFFKYVQNNFVIDLPITIKRRKKEENFILKNNTLFFYNYWFSLLYKKREKKLWFRTQKNKFNAYKVYGYY